MEIITLSGLASKIIFYDDHYEINKLLNKDSKSYDNTVCVLCNTSAVIIFSLDGSKDNFNVSYTDTNCSSAEDLINKAIQNAHDKSTLWQTYSKRGNCYFGGCYDNAPGCFYLNTDVWIFKGLDGRVVTTHWKDIVTAEKKYNGIDILSLDGNHYTFKPRYKESDEIIACINKRISDAWNTKLKSGEIYNGPCKVDGRNSNILIANSHLEFKYVSTDYKYSFEDLQYVEAFGDILYFTGTGIRPFEIKISNFAKIKEHFAPLLSHGKKLDFPNERSGLVLVNKTATVIQFEDDQIEVKDIYEPFHIKYSDVTKTSRHGSLIKIKDFEGNTYEIKLSDDTDTEKVGNDIISLIHLTQQNSDDYKMNVSDHKKEQYIHSKNQKREQLAYKCIYYPELGMIEVSSLLISLEDLIDLRVQVETKSSTKRESYRDGRSGTLKHKNVVRKRYILAYVITSYKRGNPHTQTIHVMTTYDASEKTAMRASMNDAVSAVKALKKTYQSALNKEKVNNLKEYIQVDDDINNDNLYDGFTKDEECTDTVTSENNLSNKNSTASTSHGKANSASSLSKLDSLVGLDIVKKDVNGLVNLIRVNKKREEKGLKATPISLHLVFSGNPGTGKTTVARILAEIYKEIGILKKGQLIEVDRSSLVAGYTGQTALKTKEKVKEALGGILFIDEAYTLAQDDDDNFGQEAIDTILKMMEDHRNDLIVIVAGYTDEMKKFIGSNPGLKSRFNKYIEFEDYSEQQLLEIFKKMCVENNYTLSEDGLASLNAKISKMVADKDENFANARELRNLFETVITNQATRLAAIGIDDAEADVLQQLTAQDFEDFPT